MKILVTGGAGYIGIHSCVVLLEAGHDVTDFNNLCISFSIALKRAQEIAGHPLRFVFGDSPNPVALNRALDGGVDAGIHCGTLKAVGNSRAGPLGYFDSNIVSTFTLLQAKESSRVRNLGANTNAMKGSVDQ